MTKPQDPRDILIEWIENRGCTVQWLSAQIGYTRVMVSRVINKHVAMSKRMVRDLNAEFDLQLTWIPDQPIINPSAKQKTPALTD